MAAGDADTTPSAASSTMVVATATALGSAGTVNVSSCGLAVAAASLGQVYRWRLKQDGSMAAVKVQRPDMTHAVALDIYILRKIPQPI